MKRLTKYKDGKFLLNHSSMNEAIEKLWKFENYEEQIKCPISVILQAIEKGIYVKSETTNNKLEHWYPDQIKFVKAIYQLDICKIGSRSNKYVGAFNYKKTWSLNKDDLLKHISIEPYGEDKKYDKTKRN
jgi:hypothetical protein